MILIIRAYERKISYPFSLLIIFLLVLYMQ
jgi:hypothetical protein